MIQGITVVLYKKTLAGQDAFNCDVWTEVPTNIDNVLVAPVSTEDIVNNQELNGRKAVYQLGIPKGDENDWRDVRVDFFGKSYRTFGDPIEGIEANIPLAWHKKVYVDNYE